MNTKNSIKMSDKSEASKVPSLSDTEMLEQLESLTQTWSERPSWDTYFMATALLMASRSSCERLRVGCVIVSSGVQKNRIIAAGYNGFLPGAPHNSRVRDGHEQGTVHAEQNAICDAARRGVSLEGATAYITHFPCINCAKIISAAGIRLVKYHADYRNDELVKEILAESQVALLKL
ncbi:MAG: dCMP deaminase [Lentimonas sp.]|jgi:dCMP deaminase